MLQLIVITNYFDRLFIGKGQTYVIDRNGISQKYVACGKKKRIKENERERKKNER
jgi:hypothetical protein